MTDKGAGLLARLGLATDDAAAASADLQRRIEADGVETVRFVFSDLHGVLRGKALAAGAVGSALRNGVTAPSSLMLKDSSGRTVFPVWEADAGLGAGVMTGAADMLLVPDPASYRRLPWSPLSAWVLCDLAQANGAALPFAPRGVLKGAEARLADADMQMIVGLELEFHIYRLITPGFSHATGGMPGAPPETAPLNQGYQLLNDVEYARVEPLLDTLRRHAAAIGLPVRSVEVEFGPSQFEVTFDPAPASVQADAMTMFRALVKQVCAAEGLLATFMCKPQLPHAAASGWHLHQSLISTRTGRNLFMSDGQAPTPECAGWIAGLLEHAAASAVLTTPTANGYGRYRPGMMAPDRIQWARDNRGAMLRVLGRPDDPASRIENRSPEPGANPYLAMASQILSGLDGLQNALPAPAPVETPYAAKARQLPTTLAAAVAAFDDSTLYQQALPMLHKVLTRIKRAEWERRLAGGEDWDQREYFQLL